MTQGNSAVAKAWVLDTSLFVHFCIVERTRVLFRMRSPTKVPDYVFRTEMTGDRVHQQTREQALQAAKSGTLKVEQLTLEDVARIAELGPRRAAAVGELACAVLAERSHAGVLIDDRRARRCLSGRVSVSDWHDTETVLIDAAHRCEVTEHELQEIESVLGENRYACRVNLRNEYLMQRLTLHAATGPKGAR